MSVTTQAGVKLDINQVRDQLNKDRDTGKVSKGDYKKAMKGLNRIADSEKKGVDYQFTGNGRFKTVSGNGYSPSRNDAGVSVGTRLPITGKQVSKAMGYAQSVGLKVPETSSEGSTETQSGGNSVYTGHLGFEAPTLKFGDIGAGNIKRSVGPGKELVPDTSGEDEAKRQEINKNNANNLTQQIWDAERELEKLTSDHNSKVNDPWNVNFGSDFSINPKKLFYPEGDDQGINWGNKEEFSKKEAELRQKIAKLDGDLNTIDGGKYTRPHKKATYEGFNAGKTPTVDKLPAIGGPFIPDGLIPLAAMSTIPGTALKGLTAPVKGLAAPQIALKAPVPQTVAKTTLALPSPAKALPAPALGLPAPALQLPAPNIINKLVSNGKSGIFKRMVRLPEVKGPAPVVRRSLQRVQGPSVQGPAPVQGPPPVKGPKVNRRKLQTKFAEGGKVQAFFGGGLNQVGQAGTEWAKNRFSNPVFTAPRKMEDVILAPKRTLGTFTSKPISDRSGNPVGTKVQQGSGKETMTVDRTGIDSAWNDQQRPIDKGKLINAATGIYGAASLLTAKRPKWNKPKDLNLFIRPAEGDEDMVSRSNNAIDESVRMGTSNLRSRAGSDIQSYVQGTTAMVDNAGKAKSAVLGQNAQMKRQDEVRMAGEVNHGKQIDWQANEQYTREKNLNDLNAYQNKVQAAGNSVNNSFAYINQEEADKKNKEAQENMIKKRYGMVMLNLATTLEEQGYTEEQIIKRLEQYKAISYEKGGSLSDSTRLIEGAHKNVSAANKELSKMFREYSKLISMASIENIRQFNQNIRAINSRKNLTIFSR